MIWIIVAYFIVGCLVAALSVSFIAEEADNVPFLVGLWFIEVLVIWPIVAIFFLIKGIGSIIITLCQRKDGA